MARPAPALSWWRAACRWCPSPAPSRPFSSSSLVRAAPLPLRPSSSLSPCPPRSSLRPFSRSHSPVLLGFSRQVRLVFPCAFRLQFAPERSLAPCGNGGFRYASIATSENSKPAEEVAEGITLTDNCIRRIQEIKAEDGSEGENKMLRLSVEGGGCSGFLYNFALDDKVNKDDRVFERDGAKLVVDDISYGFIKGATVDFTEELIRASFAVTINPNAASACGCGASFNAK